MSSSENPAAATWSRENTRCCLAARAARAVSRCARMVHSMAIRCDSYRPDPTGGRIPELFRFSAASSHRPSAAWGVFLHGGLGGAPAAAGDEVGHQAGPPGLVGRAEAGAIVTVEVLMERNEVVPGRIGLELLLAGKDGSAAAG